VIAIALVVAALSIAAAATVIRLRRPQLDYPCLARSSIAVAWLLFFAAPALIGASTAAEELLLQVNQARAVAIFAAAVAGLVVWARIWPERLGNRPFVALTIALALIAKLTFAALVSVDPASDFEFMWESATSRLADDGLLELREMKPDERVLTWRSALYLWPLRELFGPERTSYAVVNQIACVLCSLCAYLLAARFFGAAAARVTLVLSLAAVEPLLASSIPTHDIPGALLVLLGLLAGMRLIDALGASRWRSAWAWVAVSALLLLGLELQRNLGLLLGATLLGMGVVALRAANPAPPRRRLWAAAAVLAAPLLFTQTAQAGLVRAQMQIAPADAEQLFWLSVVAATDGWADGTWSHWYNTYYVFYRPTPVDWSAIVAPKLASETFHAPASRLESYQRKSRHLYDLGSQVYFYTDGDDLWVASRGLAAARFFSIGFLVLGVVGAAWVLFFRPTPISSFVPLAFICVVSAALLLLLEVQPRFLFFIWYAGAPYAAVALTGTPPAGR
jgi:hypothetical protein